MSSQPLAIVAFGGNALIQKGQSGSAEQQMDNLKKPLGVIARLSNEFRFVITHGNGPQAGNVLLQQEATDEVAKMPLDVVGAMTQGQIGYMVESVLEGAMSDAGVTDKSFCTILTYTIVDEKDPLFTNYTKPVGPFYTKEQAAKLSYVMKETDKGMRRVVASPIPQSIVQLKEIKTLVDKGFIVICTGGGGVPVLKKGGKLIGAEAVIDKDLATAVLAKDIKADIFLICTDAPGAAVNWGKPDQKILGRTTLSEMEKYVKEGHFPSGSMGPKVAAMMEYVRVTGGRGIICHLEDFEKALHGQAGTEIVRG